MFERRSTGHSDCEVEVIQGVSAPKRSVEAGAFWVPVQLNQPAGLWVLEQSPHPPAPASCVPFSNDHEPQGACVESKRTGQIRHSKAGILESHSGTRQVRNIKPVQGWRNSGRGGEFYAECGELVKCKGRCTPPSPYEPQSLRIHHYPCFGLFARTTNPSSSRAS